MTIKQQTISGIGWSAGASIAGQILDLAISIILARLLTPEAFGLVGMTAVFTGFVAIFGDMGFSSALIQRRVVEDRHLSSIFWLNIAFGILLTTITIAAASPIATFYKDPQIKPLMFLVGINFTLSSFGIIQRTLLRRELSFRQLTIIENSSTLIAGFVAVILAFAGYGAYALVGQILVANLIAILFLWLTSKWRPQLTFDLEAAKELLAYSSNLLGFTVFNYWSRNADNLLIGKFLGSSELGIYTRAYSIMLLPLTQISAIVGRVMFPALSKIQMDKQKVKHIYLRSISMIALITFPMMLGLLVISDTFVMSLYGPQWSQVIPILRIFCLVGMVQSVSSTAGWIYQSQGRTDWMFRWGIGAGVTVFISFAVGIRWGALGVAVSYAVVSVPLTYISFFIVGKLLDSEVLEVIQATSGVFLCAAVMATLVWLITWHIPQTWSYWQYLVIQISVGIVIYLVLIHTFKLKAYLEIKTLFLEYWGWTRGKVNHIGSELEQI